MSDIRIRVTGCTGNNADEHGRRIGPWTDQGGALMGDRFLDHMPSYGQPG